jgi:hypothetical protein
VLMPRACFKFAMEPRQPDPRVWSVFGQESMPAQERGRGATA